MSIHHKPSIAILGSARKHGNTSVVLHRLIAGSGCEIVDLLATPVAPFNYEDAYPESDPFLSIANKIIQAPLTIMATPVYWYSYSTPTKVFIDRFSDLLGPHKELGRQLRGRHFALVTSSSEPFPDQILVQAFSSFCDYLGIHYIGCAHAQGAGEFVNPEVVRKIRGHLNGPAVASK